jgi:hypothetical protein
MGVGGAGSRLAAGAGNVPTFDSIKEDCIDVRHSELELRLFVKVIAASMSSRAPTRSTCEENVKVEWQHPFYIHSGVEAIGLVKAGPTVAMTRCGQGVKASMGEAFGVTCVNV